MRPKRIKVVATQKGFFGTQLRRPADPDDPKSTADEFFLDSPEQFSESWMELVDKKDMQEIEKVKAAKQATKKAEENKEASLVAREFSKLVKENLK